MTSTCSCNKTVADQAGFTVRDFPTKNRNKNLLETFKLNRLKLIMKVRDLRAPCLVCFLLLVKPAGTQPCSNVQCEPEGEGDGKLSCAGRALSVMPHCDLHGIYLWNLSQNRLGSEAFRNTSLTLSNANDVVSLILKSNRITHLFENMFAVFEALQYLDMSYNKITHLDIHTRSFPDVRFLLLENNIIDSITCSLNGEVHIGILTIDGNPLLCDCKFKAMVLPCIRMFRGGGCGHQSFVSFLNSMQCEEVNDQSLRIQNVTIDVTSILPQSNSSRDNTISKKQFVESQNVTTQVPNILLQNNNTHDKPISNVFEIISYILIFILAVMVILFSLLSWYCTKGNNPRRKFYHYNRRGTYTAPVEEGNNLNIGNRETL